jgi:hypothetical protein
MREDHVLAKKQILAVPDLRGINHNWPLSMNNGLTKSYIAACISEGFYPDIVFETSDFDMLIKTILTQNLVHITVSCVLNEYLPKGLAARPLVHETLKIEVGFFMRPTIKANPLVQSYINAVSAWHAR